MTEQVWKVGDWAAFEFSIVQIKEDHGDGFCEVSDGSFCTSGKLMDSLRPLTLRNKRITEWFDWHYRELNKINGNRGFNFPDISRHFCGLILRAIDAPDEDRAPFDEAQNFLKDARDYKTTIQGVQLFRDAA